MADRRLDRIFIRDLRARCIVGIYPEERSKKQDIEINIVMHADLSKAARTDRIEDTIDYKAIKKSVLALVERSEFFLIERLAGSIADLVLEDAMVERVEITLDKPGALRFARSVAIDLVRTREHGS